jgi:hypothetical protein
MLILRLNLPGAAIFALALSAAALGGCCHKNAYDQARLSPCPKTKPCHLDVDPNDKTQKHHVMVTAGSVHKKAQSSVEWCYSKTAKTDVFTVAFPDDSPLDPNASLTSTINTSVTPNTNCIGPIDVTSYAQSSAGVDGFRYTITGPNFSIDPHVIVVGGSGP